MATLPRQRRTGEVEYPTGDGKPMADAELHLHNMVDTIQTLDDYFAPNPGVHVGGNLLVYYEEGNRHKHASPDVFVAFGIPKLPLRDCYLVWKEGKAPDAVIEITSKTTKREDSKKKHEIYRDMHNVAEYFLFDPTQDYLTPPLQGFRLEGGDYVAIEPVAGRLPSKVLSLHLERDGQQLRLFDPGTGARLLTPREARQQLAVENERLRREIEALRDG
jgi:Uma2 family endonuclease